jgi:hypothetical protein
LSQAINQLSKLVTRDAYRADREHIFPSKSALDWFIRSHRDQLVKSKVLLILAGRKVIDAEIMDAMVLEIGHKQAEAAGE